MTLMNTCDGYLHHIGEYEHQYYCESNGALYEFSIIKGSDPFHLHAPLMDGYGFSYSNQEKLDHKYLIEIRVTGGSMFMGYSSYFSIKDTQLEESVLPRSFKRCLRKFIKNIAFA